LILFRDVTDALPNLTAETAAFVIANAVFIWLLPVFQQANRLPLAAFHSKVIQCVLQPLIGLGDQVGESIVPA